MIENNIAPEQNMQAPAVQLPWGSRDVAKGVLSVLVGTSFLVILIASLAAYFDVGDSVTGLVLSGLVELILVAVAWKFSISSGKGTWRDLGFRPQRKGVTYGAVPIGIAACLLTAITYGVIIQALGADDRLKEPEFLKNPAWGLYTVGAIMAVIVAPLAEETFFRGFVFGGLFKRARFWGPALISAFLFMVAHLEPLVFVPIFLIGLVLAAIYAKTGSLFTTILIHMGYNGAVLGISASGR